MRAKPLGSNPSSMAPERPSSTERCRGGRFSGAAGSNNLPSARLRAIAPCRPPTMKAAAGPADIPVASRGDAVSTLPASSHRGSASITPSTTPRTTTGRRRRLCGSTALSARFKAERTPVDRHVVRRGRSAAAAAAVARGDPQGRWPEGSAAPRRRRRRRRSRRRPTDGAPDGATDGRRPRATTPPRAARCRAASRPPRRVEGRVRRRTARRSARAAAADEFTRARRADVPQARRGPTRAGATPRARRGGGGGARAGAAAPPAIERCGRQPPLGARARGRRRAREPERRLGDSLMRQLHLALACRRRVAGLELLGDGDAIARAQPRRTRRTRRATRRCRTGCCPRRAPRARRCARARARRRRGRAERRRALQPRARLVQGEPAGRRGRVRAGTGARRDERASTTSALRGVPNASALGGARARA